MVVNSSNMERITPAIVGTGYLARILPMCARIDVCGGRCRLRRVIWSLMAACAVVERLADVLRS